MSKQDRQGVRTAADLERKHGFGKSFGEVFDLIEKAQEAVKQANQAIADIAGKLTDEEVFNILTNNGQEQGVYRGDDGKIYINANYMMAGTVAAARINAEELFAKDINMTGKFISTAQVFMEPGLEEMLTIKNHILKTALIDTSKISLYDFNNDGNITITDMQMCNAAMRGKASLAGWTGAVKSAVTVTIDLTVPNKAICISGMNMWGRKLELYFGINGAKADNILGDVAVGGKLAVGELLFEGNTLAIGSKGEPMALSWKDNGDGTFTLIGQ